MKRSCGFIPSFTGSCLTIQNQAGLVKLCSNPQISPLYPVGHCVAANAQTTSRGAAWELSDGNSWTQELWELAAFSSPSHLNGIAGHFGESRRSGQPLPGAESPQEPWTAGSLQSCHTALITFPAGYTISPAWLITG